MDLTFPFPFEPYSIQNEFMKQLYLTLQNSKLGIFESPTGTGKSLSMCCGALKWLKDHTGAIYSNLLDEINIIKAEIQVQNDTDNWLEVEYDKIQKTQKLNQLQMKLDIIHKREEKFRQMKERVQRLKDKETAKKHEWSRLNSKKTAVLGEVEKDNTTNDTTKNTDDLDLLLDDEKDDLEDTDNDINEEPEKDDFMKIIISSRTHSQLSQFVGEVKRTIFGNDTKLVTIASRQHYCINSEVLKLKNVNLINERCLDLQKSQSKKTKVDEDGRASKKTKITSCSSCPYYNKVNIEQLKEKLLTEILDVEELVTSGKTLKACPYYATRAASKEAQVVLLSHAGVVSSGARSGFGVNLQGYVLLLDEAHGLTSALEKAHAAPLSAQALNSTRTCLNNYVKRYRAKLSSKNLLKLNQILFITGKLLDLIVIKDGDKSKTAEVKVNTLEDFVIRAEIDHLNFQPLIEFCRDTKLGQKLHGFSMRYTATDMENDNKAVSKSDSLKSFLNTIVKKNASIPTPSDASIQTPPKSDEQTKKMTQQVEGSAGSSLYTVINFLEMLCNRSEDGRIMCHRDKPFNGQLKYLLLNPSTQFANVVQECRSVVLAGGTMEPMNEFYDLLLGNKSFEPERSKINILRCDHVVSPENVLAVCLSQGPTNCTLKFTYENRNSVELLNEVSRILRNVCAIVPGGIICFLPSYKYEQQLYDHLKNTQVLQTICKKKNIFREPKSSAEVDQVLNDYALSINCKDGRVGGALLFSVVGGKLSEGLNFSDNLGRCVIVVGMPYPNVKSPELQEKMSYLNKHSGPGAGNVYYENLCMKAVNQCIGRAVRHINDYASVLLLDARYSRPATSAALPSFIQKSLMVNQNFGPTVGAIARFFSKHKTT